VAQRPARPQRAVPGVRAGSRTGGSRAAPGRPGPSPSKDKQETAHQPPGWRVRLERAAGNNNPIAGLAPSFFAEVPTLIETPWSVAILDFAFPNTRGQRPADFEMTRNFGIALTRLAAEDPAVHKLTVEVQHLLKPSSVYRDPALVQRVLAKMAEV